LSEKCLNFDANFGTTPVGCCTPPCATDFKDLLFIITVNVFFTDNLLHTGSTD